MDIKAHGTIESFAKSEEGSVNIVVKLKGRSAEVGTHPTDATANLLLTVKTVVAEKLRFGEKLYVTISTKPLPEEP